MNTTIYLQDRIDALIADQETAHSKRLWARLEAAKEELGIVLRMLETYHAKIVPMRRQYYMIIPGSESCLHVWYMPVEEDTTVNAGMRRQSHGIGNCPTCGEDGEIIYGGLF